MPGSFRISKEPWCHRRQPVRTIEGRRQVVIDHIDKWVEKLKGSRTGRTRKLSQIEGDERLVRLVYGNQDVPLNDEGDLTGVIDVARDEFEYWEWMKDQVQAGVYDQGINEAAMRIGEQLNTKM